MAQKYGFFNSVNHDRTYDASDVAKYIAKYFTNGIFNNSMQVTANDNMTVNVAVGSANINGYSYETDEVLTLDINDADDTLSRIDSVIVRLDLTNRQITTQILEGSYASTPSQPTIIRTGNIYDLRLANILVSANTTRITATEITDTRFTSDCGNVVQAVQHLDTNDIFVQYQTMWNNWFANLQDQLDDNQAGHLQNEIDDINDDISALDANLNNKIGNLSDLNTTDKSSVVNAINEINNEVVFETKLTEAGSEIVATGLDLANDLHYEFELIGASNNDSEINMTCDSIASYNNLCVYSTNKTTTGEATKNAYQVAQNRMGNYFTTTNSSVSFKLTGELYINPDFNSDIVVCNKKYRYSNQYSPRITEEVSHFDANDVNTIRFYQPNNNTFRAGTKLVVRKVS